MRHTRYGYWLEEAGPVEPTRPLEGDTTADVVVVGGGYLGLWTAWQLKALEPGLDVVVLEAGLAGHGPSGRNGGFVSTLWDDLPILRDRVGDARAVEVCRASERAVHGIGAWCDDAGRRRAGTGPAARSRSRRARRSSATGTSSSRPARRSARPRRRSRCRATRSPRAAPRRRSSAACSCRPPRTCSRRASSLGLRAKVIEAGVRLHERTPVRAALARRGASTPAARCGATPPCWP